MYRSAWSSPHSRRVYFQMPSRSRSAAGESRYSAMHATEPALECACIEALRLSALFTLDQRRANDLDLGPALLLSPNEITDVFAIVGVVAAFDLRLDPVVLLIRQRNGLAYSCHGRLQICTNSVIKSYHRCGQGHTVRQTSA